jgi:hypothetical protein
LESDAFQTVEKFDNLKNLILTFTNTFSGLETYDKKQNLYTPLSTNLLSSLVYAAFFGSILHRILKGTPDVLASFPKSVDLLPCRSKAQYS